MKDFRVHIVIRVIIISALSLAFSYVIVRTNWFFTPTIIGIVWILFVANLIWYISRTNNDLTAFLLNIRQGDYTTSIASGRMGKSFSHLSKAFNEVIGELEKLNFERETHYQYLQTLTENIGVGIISYDEDGKVHLANPEAKRLLQSNRLSTIESIRNVHPGLFEKIMQLRSGERQLVHLPIGQDMLSLSVHSKELKLNEVSYRVVLLQDLRNELEDKEVEAWQKLIRVLTHEIMNSVTPIVTLSQAVNRMMRKSDGSYKNATELNEEDFTDIHESLGTIEGRSRGLLKFVNAYKDFSKTQDVKLSRVKLGPIIERVVSLLRPELYEKGISFHVGSGAKQVMADADLAEQVLINIIRNAIDVLSGVDDPRIVIKVASGGSNTKIVIGDNGPGLEKDLMEKIFVPFFTTKKEGTGIGLSWSRQIMRLHGGNLYLKSAPGRGTQVELVFRNA